MASTTAAAKFDSCARNQAKGSLGSPMKGRRIQAIWVPIGRWIFGFFFRQARSWPCGRRAIELKDLAQTASEEVQAHEARNPKEEDVEQHHEGLARRAKSEEGGDGSQARQQGEVDGDQEQAKR